MTSRNLCVICFGKKTNITVKSIYVLPIYENRSRVKVCLVRVHGRGCCDKLSYVVMVSWLLPTIDFSVLRKVLLFSV